MTVGVGIHTGAKARLTINPAPPGHGIVFRRADLLGRPLVHARAEHVCDTSLCTRIAENGATVATVEHLLAALAGLGIDNALIELDGPEVPILDGSSAPFVYLLREGGVIEQAAGKRFIKVKKAVSVELADKYASLHPHHGFKLDFEVDFRHPVFAEARTRRTALEFSTQSFLRQVARARTFGFMRDLEALRDRNLALGGSLENAVVLDEFRVLNDDGLRYDDELVRHKLLDAIGDLYLAGLPILGAYRGYKSGHELNNKLVRALLADATAFEIVSFDSPGSSAAPINYWEPAFVA